MKKISFSKLVIVKLLVLSLFLFPCFAAKKNKIDNIKFPALNKFELPEIKKAMTGNGIKLRLIKNEALPLIDLEILIRGGDVYDPATKVGLATITAQLLRIGGTAEMEPEQLDQLLDSKGISIDCNSGNDFTTISLSCLKENFSEAVAILAKILRQPAFNKDKLAEIKTQLGSSVSRRNDDPGNINSREFATLLYGKKSPFAAVLEYEHIDNISMEDIRGVYKTFFAPANMLTGIVGPLEIEEVKAVFEKHFGPWNNTAHIPPYPVFKEPDHDFKLAFAEKSNLNQSYLSIGHIGVKEDIKDFKEKAKIKIFNSIFSAGFTSRLMSRVRVKMGLTYGIYGGIKTGLLYPGTTSFTTFTKSGSTIEAVKAIFDEIDIIKKEKVSEKELKDAKDYYLNSYVFQFSSPAQILSNALAREFYGIDEDFRKNLLDSIKDVTADDVLKIANKYLHSEKMIVSIVGKEEDIPGKLSDIGKVKKIDITIPSPPLKEIIPAATAEMLARGRQLITSLVSTKYRGYKGLRSLEVIADTKMTISGRVLPIGIKNISLFPDKNYNEMSIMGMKIEVVVNGDNGMMKQMGQVKPLPEKDIADSRFSDLYFIFNNQETYKFQYLKETKIDKKIYDVLYLFDAQKNWIKLFINKETRLIEIEETVSKLPGTSGITRKIKSDFRIISGIPFAFKSETFIKDKRVGETIIKKIKVNSPVDTAIFHIDKKK
jgi:zinc protease